MALIAPYRLWGLKGFPTDMRENLSQGERQLVSIARATAVEPIALLLDEPAAGLDTTETLWLGEKIRGIAGSGVGVLLVDHDVELVLTSCDYIYVLDLGKMIAEGGPETIQNNQAVTDAYFGQSIPQCESMSGLLECKALTGGRGERPHLEMSICPCLLDPSLGCSGRTVPGRPRS